MIERRKVYEDIDGRLSRLEKLFGVDEGGVKTPPKPARVEQWVNFIRCLFAANVRSYGSDSENLDSLAMVAAACVGCMEGSVPRSDAYRQLDFLADGIPTPRSVDGYVLMAAHYLQMAVRQWATQAGDEEALAELRKLAAVCIRCIEEHGK